MYRLSERVDQCRGRQHLLTAHSFAFNDDVSIKDTNTNVDHFELAYGLADCRRECLSDAVFDFNLITLGNACGDIIADCVTYCLSNTQRDHIRHAVLVVNTVELEHSLSADFRLRQCLTESREQL